MKHDFKIVMYMIVIFFISQLIGLGILNQYLDYQLSAEHGEAEFKPLPYDIERPEIEENYSWIYILVAVIIGTILVLFIIKFKKPVIWKAWFYIAVVLCLTISFGSFLNRLVALFAALILGVYKVFKPNIYVHNFTEIFMYGGLAAIFVPVINILSGIILLVLIAGYDIYAVWKSKHMVKMAKFQSESKVFAGLLIPYAKIKGKTKIISAKQQKISKTIQKDKKTKKYIKQAKAKQIPIRHAVLGGGDIGFPLIFAGVVMKNLMITNTFLAGFLKTLIIPVCATVALAYLFYIAKKDKFYPAMPFISSGCILGYLLILLINLFV